MIGDYVPSDVVGSKKRSLAASPDSKVKSKLSIMSPPSKKLKQARLPFKVLSSPSPNQCHKSPTVDTLPTKKRKHSGSEKSPASSILSTKGKTPDVKTTLKKTLESSIKKKVAVSPGTPKRPCIQASDLEPEVTSSCEDQDGGKATSSSTTPRRLTTTKPKLLDSFLQITQQPQVSTSDDVIEIEDDETNEVFSTSHAIEVPQDKEVDIVSDGGSEQLGSNKKEMLEEEVLIDLTLEMSQDSKSASKLGYDADMEDEDEEEVTATPTAVSMEEDAASETSGESSEAESSTGTLSSAGTLSTPKVIAKTASKTPLSAKALKKEEERRKFREEKIKVRMEKKRKLEEEEAERKRQKTEFKIAKEQEREEAKRQKELEKEEKKKEKQLKKEQEDLDREQKKMAKEEEKKKKQDIIDAKMEEKRKKIEEKQQQEDEKLQQEEEKRKKEARQKNFFKSFFKEPAPVKKIVEKSSSWYAPFQVKERMVLAPLCRNPSFIDAKESFDAAFTDQNCTTLYFEELRSKTRTAGKMGQTPSAKTKEKEATSRTTTPSVEKMVEENGDSQDVELVSVSPKPTKQMARMKCKFLQFHENYRPAYYGTWRQSSKTINPRNYLKKDEDVLDYEIDSDDEWEEPGESLSHSEGEEDGEDDVEAGDSDDGFFVPHGYLSESEGCEDEEEEVENWKARRAAKAKSWEVELKRQQGVLKPVIVGCLWETASSKASIGNLKTMDAYKIVALTATPIDIRRKKQTTTSTEEIPKKDSTLKNVKSIMGVSQGISMKRPVPAEAMPDLIRLVHGNVAGIRTLQREFREFWRLETLKKNSGKPSPSNAVDVPSTSTPTGVSSKCTPGTPEGTHVSPNSSVTPGGELDKPSAVSAQQTGGAVDACQGSPNVTLIRGGVGTSVMPTPGVTSTTDNTTTTTTTTADNIDCSISKRQLLITINAIAVRERRPEHTRTCWYVHNDLLQHYNLQSLPIPSEWQYITKPQKAMRADSPLLGHGIPTVNYNHTRINPAGGLPVIMPQSQGMPMRQAYTPSLNSSMAHPHGIPSEVQWRLHGNTVRENLASLKSGQVKPATEMILSQPMIQPAGGVHIPTCINSSVYNCMSPMEIIQKLSQSIPRQPVPQPRAQLFKPALSNEQVHYMNMLPKQTVVSHPTSTSHILDSLSLQYQIDNVARLGHEVKVPHMSPTDIKAMLALQAATERAARSNLIKMPSNTPTSALPQLASSSAAPASRNPEDSTGLSLPQQPTKKTATLKNFFKPSTTCTTEKMDTSEDIKEGSDTKEISVSKGLAPTILADSSEINKVGPAGVVNKQVEKTNLDCPEEKMSIEVSQEVNKGDVIIIE